MVVSLYTFAIMGVATTIAVFIAATTLAKKSRTQKLMQRSVKALRVGPVFLFDQGQLVDATPDALSLIATYSDQMSDFDAMIRMLGPHFPKLRDVLESPPEKKRTIDAPTCPDLWLEISETAGRLRIAVCGGSKTTTQPVKDSLERDIHLSELAMLREITQHTPQLMWHEDRAGRLIWANQAYMKIADQMMPPHANSQAIWPNTSIFPNLHNLPGPKGTSFRRLSAKLFGQSAEHWFDVTSTPLDTGFLHFATDANAIVRAEQQRRSFVQTLGKTFAELSTGLAVFDKRRELAMFNPALLDMTGLPFDFLSSRPSLDAVLDRLREARKLPEPKNYASWREQFKALEDGAKNGTYSERWALPDGQTLRVSGRPHPDGAFAFLLEDVSAEVSLTRRFRSDIETGQAVLDSVSEAIAVFSSAGHLVMANKAYVDLWQTNPALYHEHRMLQTEMKVWQRHSDGSHIWTQIRNFTHQLGPRASFTDSTVMDDGRPLRCHVSAITGGKTLVKFTADAHINPVLQKLNMRDTTIRIGKR